MFIGPGPTPAVQDAGVLARLRALAAQAFANRPAAQRRGFPGRRDAVVRAVAGGGYPHVPPGKPILQPDIGIVAPGPAGYFAPTAEEPSLMITDPPLYRQLHPSYPYSRGPLMPEEGIVGPGAGGYFGPGGVPFTPGVRVSPGLDRQQQPDLASLLASLFAGRPPVRY
jgi:hypothetical protein